MYYPAMYMLLELAGAGDLFDKIGERLYTVCGVEDGRIDLRVRDAPFQPQITASRMTLPTSISTNLSRVS